MENYTFIYLSLSLCTFLRACHTLRETHFIVVTTAAVTFTRYTVVLSSPHPSFIPDDIIFNRIEVERSGRILWTQHPASQNGDVCRRALFGGTAARMLEASGT